MFLTDEQKQTLTGYLRPSKQAEWLRKHGITFWMNARGEPVVPASAINGKPETGWKPDFSGVR